MRNVLKKGRSAPQWTRYAVAGLFAAVLAGCGGGSDGTNGINGTNGKDVDPSVVNNLTAQIAALTQATNPETCVLCHNGTDKANGQSHQAAYDVLYQQGINVSNISVSADKVSYTTTLTFTLKNGTVPVDCTQRTWKDQTGVQAPFAIGSYWVKYDSTTGFTGELDSATKSTVRFSLFPTVQAAYDAAKALDSATKTVVTGDIRFDSSTGVCTVTRDFTKNPSTTTSTTVDAYKANVVALADALAGTGNGIVQIYGVDQIQAVDAAGITKGKYPFGAVQKVGTVGYSSAATVSGCESCHTTPFAKHGYILGYVGTGTDFVVCKGCHVDNGTGGHQFWQVLKDAKDSRTATSGRATGVATTDDSKALSACAVAINAGKKDCANATLKTYGYTGTSAVDLAPYAYKTKLMNDVHMSHAMEFPYPQGMNSCVACHAGKLSTVLDNSKFVAETCISCHTVKGIKAKMTASGFSHATQVASEAALRASTCSTCHNGNDAPSFSKIHNGGYDPMIYASDGTRYSTPITANIGAVTFDSAANKLNIKVTASGVKGTLDAANITPTILVGLYGYDSKDFIVPAHGSQADKTRNLEYVYGSTNPRFVSVGKTKSGDVTTWEVTADLSLWADLIKSGAVKRAEIAAMPTLKDAAGTVLALNAPSKTFNLVTKADLTSTEAKALGMGTAIVSAAKCNSCHDALATSFHTADRGGNVVVCRICHEVTSPGSHLEMQSRSIDSYVHAIHSFQAFDIKNFDMSDKFAAMEYASHIGTEYPKFGIQDCKSCHNDGTYDVPSQVKSMPSSLSASSVFTNGTRNIPAVAQSIVGPASRACGSCHRSQAINADDAVTLSIVNSHIKQQGYMVDASAYSSSTTPTLYDLWKSLTTKLMNMF